MSVQLDFNIKDYFDLTICDENPSELINDNRIYFKKISGIDLPLRVQFKAQNRGVYSKVVVDVKVCENWVRLGHKSFYHEPADPLNVLIYEKFMPIFQQALIMVINNYEWLKNADCETYLTENGDSYVCVKELKNGYDGMGYPPTYKLEIMVNKEDVYFDDFISLSNLKHTDLLPIQAEEVATESTFPVKIKVVDKMLNRSYPDLGRLEMCQSYCGTDIDISKLNTNDVISLKTTRGTVKSFNVIHCELGEYCPRAMLIEVNKSQTNLNIKYIISENDMANSYDALFMENRKQCKGWKAKRLLSVI